MANERAVADHKRTTLDFLKDEPSEAEFRRWRREMGVCSEASYTYFAWGRSYHLVKIGRSFDPSRRKLELQLQHHQLIEIVATVRGDFELCYHRHFERHKFKSEWFEPHPDILAEIARLSPQHKKEEADAE